MIDDKPTDDRRDNGGTPADVPPQKRGQGRHGPSERPEPEQTKEPEPSARQMPSVTSNGVPGGGFQGAPKPTRGKKHAVRGFMRRFKGVAASFAAGAAIAAAMAASVAVSPPLRDFFAERMTQNGIGLFMAYWVAGMLILIAVIYVQIIIHEGGHLVCGLATGYRFVSFRVASIILYRDGGRLRAGRFSIAGTGGQCLLEPPTDEAADAERMPYLAYCMGGTAANMAAAVAAAMLVAGIQGVAAAFTASMFVLTGIVMAAMNGIPMRAGGIPNDGYNARTMARRRNMRRMLWVQLKVNAQYSRGRLLREMPDEWFSIPEGEDLANPMYTTVAMFDVWRRIERRDFTAADALLRHLHARDSRMIELFRLEITGDRMFTAAMLRRPKREIRRILTESAARYLAADAPYNISHALELYAWERFVEGDAERAADRAETIRRVLPRHHARGEAADCADLLAWMETLADDYLCD